MELSEDQKSAVTVWVQEGRSIAEIQRMLREDYKLSMTYMDIRFLVDDLDVAVVETATEEEEEDSAREAETVEDAELVNDGASGGVQVEVDAVMRPGSLVSGTVNFSDGQSLGWQLSATGQLGLIPDENNPEYRPSPEDLDQFQTQLEDVLKKKGF
jgi:hypothetical protein